MKHWLIAISLCGLAWARPGLSASEARAMSQQQVTYRQMCRKPDDQVRDQLLPLAAQFELTDLLMQKGYWLSGGRPGRAVFHLPPTLQGRVLQVTLDATFTQGEAHFFTGNELAEPAEELLTFHVPAWANGCDHFISHRVRVMGAQTLLFSLPARSQMQLRRLLVQALN